MRKLRYRLGTLAELTKQIDCSKPLAVDFETAGLYGEIQLAQFYQAHWTSALLVPKPDKYALLAVFQTSTIVAHNTCYEVSTLQAVTGFPVVPKSWEDTLLLAKLEFFKAERYSLDLCYIYALGLDPYEAAGIDKKAMQKAPWAGELSEAQLTYAAIDVFYLLDLYDACAKHLDSPVYLLDKAATTRAFKFQCNGLHYNAALGAELMATNQQRLSQLSLPINVNSWKQVRPYIGEDQSTGLDLALFALQGNTRARDVREARKLLKQNSFLTKFEKTSKSGRIYGKFSFTTKSGRGNCKDQNLQQLPRVTKKCFTAEEGNVLVMSDYAQLELRYGCAYVGELAMSELFKAGVDLHQHTADAMKVPRQQAKTCIAEGQLVLTSQGLIPIESVPIEAKVWDGENFVRHDGPVYQGIKEVITHEGLTGTRDHICYRSDGSTVTLGEANDHKTRIVRTGYGGQTVRLSSCLDQSKVHSGAEKLLPNMLLPLQRSKVNQKRLLHSWQNRLQPLYKTKSRLCAYPRNGRGAESKERSTLELSQVVSRPVARCATTLSESFQPELQKLRRSRHNLRLCKRARSMLLHRRRVRFAPSGPNARQKRQFKGLLKNKHPVCYAASSNPQSQSGQLYGNSRQAVTNLSYPACLSSLAESITRPRIKPSRNLAKVWDLANCGPNHRFTVGGYLVSNCNFNLLYGGSANMLRSIFIKDCDILLPIEDVRLMKKKWHNLWPILTAWQERTTSNWRSGKSQCTILGRNFKSKLYTDAMNLPIQGGSAEVAKLALHKMMKAIAAEDQLKSVQLVNFIHDSFMFECPDDKFVYTKLAELIATSMHDAWLELVKYTKIPDLPMPVDVLVGKNWGNIEYGVDKPLYTLTLEA